MCINIIPKRTTKVGENAAEERPCELIFALFLPKTF